MLKKILKKIRTTKHLRAKILISVFFLWFGYTFWPTPVEKQIRRALDKIVQQVEFTAPLEVLEARLKASELVEILADTVKLEYRSPEDEYIRTFSRKEALDATTSGLIRVTKLSVGYSLFKLKFADSGTARARFLLVAEWNGSERAAEDVQLDFEKQGSKWKIVKIQTFPRLTL